MSGPAPGGEPVHHESAVPGRTDPVLLARELEVSYPARGASLAAVRGVSLHVGRGECLGVVGESGAGKSQLFLAAMGLLGKRARIAGSVHFEGRQILGLAPSALNEIRGSKLTMIFQDPMTSLTPHVRVGVQLAEVLVHHGGASWAGARRRALEVLEQVRVPEAARRMLEYPHELSGGLRQRVMIGMSLMCEPALLIADEPTSALDVTVQAQIIELFKMLRRERSLSLALISHDMAVIAALADRIVVMYAGRVVEAAPAAELLRGARHPYTALLIRCVPDLEAPRPARMPFIPGQAPSPADPEAGCAFAPRCPRATGLCRAERPLLRRSEKSGEFACHHPL
jgi:oligopeptide/dipeptide ABC transporter ATP-binding protein